VIDTCGSSLKSLVTLIFGHLQESVFTYRLTYMTYKQTTQLI